MVTAIFVRTSDPDIIDRVRLIGDGLFEEEPRRNNTGLMGLWSVAAADVDDEQRAALATLAFEKYDPSNPIKRGVFVLDWDTKLQADWKTQTDPYWVDPTPPA